MWKTHKIYIFVVIFIKHSFTLNATEAPIQADAVSNISKLIETVQNVDGEDILSPTQQKISTNSSQSRSARQLYYSPQIFYIHNYINQRSQCLTTQQGKEGVCVPYLKCPPQGKFNTQLLENNENSTSSSSTQYWPIYQYEICTYVDQYNQAYNGVCCPWPIMDESDNNEHREDDEMNRPVKPDDLDRSKEDGDSEVLEVSADDLVENQSNEGNQEDINVVDYDPIKDWRRDVPSTNVLSATYWPAHMWGIAGIPAQWPPLQGTSVINWPPQIPTHPPNHHYPTHPPTRPQHTSPTTPAYDLTTKRRLTTSPPKLTSTTTKRPFYYPGNYPSYTTTKTTTTTSTTTQKPHMNGDNPYGLPLQCGRRNSPTKDQERIVGGINASPHEFPWMAVIFKSGRQLCGGSLITNNYILTAAHCVARLTSWDVSSLTVHLGDYNIRTDHEVRHIARRVKRLVRHKGFDFSHLHSDIAILMLHEPVKFSYEIQPICLPTSQSLQSRNYSGKYGLVAGWGSLRENGPQPSVLQKVQVPIWTNAECAQKYGRAAPGGIIQSMICAGQAARDSCSGDSGGPMVVYENGRYYQVGIVSWGIGCGKGQYPGVYTRVTSLLPWIYKNIKYQVAAI